MDTSEQRRDPDLDERTAWVEREIEAVLDQQKAPPELDRMLRYHLGWLGEDLEPTRAEERRRFGGKQLRGPLCLLACEAAGGDARRAAPAAAAVELIHNFSLIHDDVEDQDAERRHRPTVWWRWGMAHAVNAGSNMQALVNIAGLRLARAGVPAERVVDALDCLSRAMLAMTEGQFLDIQYEGRWDTSIQDYLEMSAGKTAALIEAAARLGSLVATDRAEVREALARFGRAFGMAFQARDDHLGIWGERDATGKPVGSDIVKGKRSLPIVYALTEADAPDLRAALEARDVAAVTARLDALQAREYVEETVARYTDQALRALDTPGLLPEPCRILRRIAQQSLGRSG